MPLLLRFPAKWELVGRRKRVNALNLWRNVSKDAWEASGE
jgi:hypothetical protein